jgi:hypothetical protein
MWIEPNPVPRRADEGQLVLKRSINTNVAPIVIPNLVNTLVKGYAQQEQTVLIGVTEARAKATSINVKPDDEASLRRFQQAQGEVSSALSRLLVVSENYPQLKSDQDLPVICRCRWKVRRIGSPSPANRVHSIRAGVQHHDPSVPGEHHGHAVSCSDEAELHGRE